MEYRQRFRDGTPQQGKQPLTSPRRSGSVFANSVPLSGTRLVNEAWEVTPGGSPRHGVIALLTGLAAGMLIFVLSSGLTLVLGVMRVVNFAHGGFFLVGAYLSYELQRHHQQPVWLFVLLIIAAVGLMPLARRTRYILLAGLAALCLVTARSDFLEHAPVEDPYVQVALPPIPRPDNTMVVMTGDAPMGFIATTLPPQIAVLRIDGWMVQPRDGTRMTHDMKRRVSAHLAGGGDLYLIADAGDMSRARDALADYGLVIRWPECQQFDTNITGTYQWCPLSRRN